MDVAGLERWPWAGPTETNRVVRRSWGGGHHRTARAVPMGRRAAGSFENQSAIETNGGASRPRVTVGKLDSLSVTTGPLDI